MVLLLAKQIITLYHAVQKTLTKDQHALVLIIKNRDDKHQSENHRLGTYFIIAISLSTFYYLKVEDYKESSTSHIYCGSIMKMKLRSSVGLLEKFALSKEKCGNGL
ncbi:hypothetical protein BCU32_013190 [Vibrio lentus]|uniref:hypothetical protein n=1 Tax=Vibrio lentus TaxID=136468 RepID=UPI0039A672D4